MDLSDIICGYAGAALEVHGGRDGRQRVVGSDAVLRQIHFAAKQGAVVFNIVLRAAESFGLAKVGPVHSGRALPLRAPAVAVH